MTEKTVLVLGGTGLLGKALIESCPAGFRVHATFLRDLPPTISFDGFARLDITDREAIIRLFQKIRPDFVVHLAGVGSVDFAEKNQSAARAVNVGGTQYVIEAGQRVGTRLIYLSSNAVFDGDHPPYREDSPRRPVNYYGRLKVEAEDIVQASGLEYAIVRPILMYGWHYAHARQNPVTMWLRLLEGCKTVRVVNDHFWQPLFVKDCADLIWRIIREDKNGVYNIAGPERLSLFDFALSAAKVFGLDSALIEPVPSSFFPTIAPRPLDTSFALDKIKSVFALQPLGILAGLERMKKTRLSERKSI